MTRGETKKTYRPNKICTERGKRLANKIRWEGKNILEIYGRLTEHKGMKTYLHGPMDYAR